MTWMDEFMETRMRIMIGLALMGILLTASGCAQGRQRQYRDHLSLTVKSMPSPSVGDRLVRNTEHPRRNRGPIISN